jgi:nitrite reductase (NADH) small subunit
VTAPTLTEHMLGPVDEIPVGEGRAFGVGGDQVAVFRLRDGRVRALSAVCPHRGGPLADGQIDNEVVICPLHLNAFELDSGCSRTGADAIHSYPVHVLDGQLFLTAPAT